MPRMTKKQKEEWTLFLNENNRRQYNDVCRRCVHECKQSFRVEVVCCPNYLSKRSARSGHS